MVVTPAPYVTKNWTHSESKLSLQSEVDWIYFNLWTIIGNEIIKRKDDVRTLDDKSYTSRESGKLEWNKAEELFYLPIEFPTILYAALIIHVGGKRYINTCIKTKLWYTCWIIDG